MAARFAAPPTWAGYVHQLYAIQGWSSMPWLHRIRHRTLVMSGDDDPIIPLVNGRILAWRIPRAHLHVVHGGRAPVPARGACGVGRDDRPFLRG